MEGLRRKLKERLELFEASRPEQSLFEQIGISLKQTFITPLTSSHHSEHSKKKDLSHGAMQTSGISSVKSSDVITLYVATERNKSGVDLGISISWCTKNYS